MILKAEQIAELLTKPEEADDPLIVAPGPPIEQLRESGSASLDIRLGTWFSTPRHTRASVLRVYPEEAKEIDDSELMKMHYVPFGRDFILQPRSFILGATLEWLRMPRKLAGYVTARSSWGRRGLIIATAVGVHPGFTGCLGLELSNLGEIPIALQPGLAVCQLFIHRVHSTAPYVDKSCFIGMRRPSLGNIELDEIAKKLFRRPN